MTDRYSEAASKTIARFQAARSAAFALDSAVGVRVTLECCQAWKDGRKSGGVKGAADALRGECWAQAQQLRDEPGAYDVFRALTFAASWPEGGER